MARKKMTSHFLFLQKEKPTAIFSLFVDGLGHFHHGVERELGLGRIFHLDGGSPVALLSQKLAIDPAASQVVPLSRHVVVMQALSRVQHLLGLQGQVFL